MAGFFDKFREALFGERRSAKPIQPPSAQERGLEVRPQVVEPERPTSQARSNTSEREPYFVQIGFDFGTAFCKCVCRDMILDKAWIHCPPGSNGAEMPYLIPSALGCDGRTLNHVNGVHGAYEDEVLCHVKMALQKVGLKDWRDHTLMPFRAATMDKSDEQLGTFVEMCAIYLLAGAIGNVKREIAERFPGHVDGDYVALNMAVPVADVDHAGVNAVFDRVLRLAWVLSGDLAGHPSISMSDLMSLVDARAHESDAQSVREACFIYPEVSANVQGFIRSRTSRPGLYLFSDAGAGTVDQSVFLFARCDGEDHLTYLHADVFPIGSSHLERLAAINDGDESWANLERWRMKKEGGENDSQLQCARKEVEGRLAKGTIKTIVCSKQKLISKSQINDLRIIFGGGGHCENPYGVAVISQFSSPYFRPEAIAKRQSKGDTFDLGMPIPQDLPLTASQRRWMDRLTVAYGLSFEKGQLANFTLPKEVEIPPPEKVWRPVRQRVSAPSKDEV